jgi:serine/threonine protein kinase
VIDFGIGQHVGAEVRAAERPELRSLYDLRRKNWGVRSARWRCPRTTCRRRGTRVGSQRQRVERARGGTLLYASPSSASISPATRTSSRSTAARSLLLGVMAFRMLTGQSRSRASHGVRSDPETIWRSAAQGGNAGHQIPRELAAFVDRCLVKEREKRWKSADEAYAALTRIVHPRRST